MIKFNEYFIENLYIDEKTENKILKILKKVKLNNLVEKMEFATRQKKTVYSFLKPNDFIVGKEELEILMKNNVEIFYSDRKIVIALRVN